MTTPDYATPCPDCGHPRHHHPIAEGQWCRSCLCRLSQATLQARGLQAGELLRDEGITHVQVDVTDDESIAWRADAASWIESLPEGKTFTAVDLTDALGMPPRPPAVGSVIRTASLQHYITHTGDYVKTSRPAAHARPIAVWRRAA